MSRRRSGASGLAEAYQRFKHLSFFVQKISQAQQTAYIQAGDKHKERVWARKYSEGIYLPNPSSSPSTSKKTRSSLQSLIREGLAFLDSEDTSYAQVHANKLLLSSAFSFFKSCCQSYILFAQANRTLETPINIRALMATLVDAQNAFTLRMISLESVGQHREQQINLWRKQLEFLGSAQIAQGTNYSDEAVYACANVLALAEERNGTDDGIEYIFDGETIQFMRAYIWSYMQNVDVQQRKVALRNLGRSLKDEVFRIKVMNAHSPNYEALSEALTYVIEKQICTPDVMTEPQQAVVKRFSGSDVLAESKRAPSVSSSRASKGISLPAFDKTLDAAMRHPVIKDLKTKYGLALMSIILISNNATQEDVDSSTKSLVRCIVELRRIRATLYNGSTKQELGSTELERINIQAAANQVCLKVAQATMAALRNIAEISFTDGDIDVNGEQIKLIIAADQLLRICDPTTNLPGLNISRDLLEYIQFIRQNFPELAADFLSDMFGFGAQEVEEQDLVSQIQSLVSDFRSASTAGERLSAISGIIKALDKHHADIFKDSRGELYLTVEAELQKIKHKKQKGRFLDQLESLSSTPPVELSSAPTPSPSSMSGQGSGTTGRKKQKKKKKKKKKDKGSHDKGADTDSLSSASAVSRDQASPTVDMEQRARERAAKKEEDRRLKNEQQRLRREQQKQSKAARRIELEAQKKEKLLREEEERQAKLKQAEEERLQREAKEKAAREKRRQKKKAKRKAILLKRHKAQAVKLEEYGRVRVKVSALLEYISSTSVCTNRKVIIPITETIRQDVAQMATENVKEGLSFARDALEHIIEVQNALTTLNDTIAVSFTTQCLDIEDAATSVDGVSTRIT